MKSSFKIIVSESKLLLVMFFGICLTLISCIEKIEIPDEFYTDNIVLNSVIDPDSSIMVNISESLPPAGVIEFEFVKDADVRVNIAGMEHEIVCQYLENGWYTSSEIVLEADRDYDINVSVADKNLSSTTRIPKKPIVENAHIQNDSILFSIKDDPDIDQYYLVTLMGYHYMERSVKEPDGTYSHFYRYEYDPMEMESNDEIIDAFIDGRVGHVNNATGLNFTDSFYELVPDYTGESFLFTDESFQGDSREFLMEITERGYWFIDSIRTVDLLVQSIDYNYYQYLLTFAQYWTTDEAPFTNRARIYNNIEGGYGIFGSRNGVKVEMQLPEYNGYPHP